MPGPTSSDANFEATFADLAFARLRDKAPSLLDYLVGFQLVDKNDEETHAVGVFGFKVGKEWVYSPVFFINGELKGHELMYIKGQDSFVPMTEQWVNYVLNRRPKILGEKEDIPRPRLNLRQPDFDLFARAPYIGSKYASANKGRMKEWVTDFLDVFSSEPWGEKYASLDVPHMLKRFGKRAAMPLFETMTSDEKFSRAVLKFYDPRELIEATKQADIDEVSKEQRRGKSSLPKPIVLTRGDDQSNILIDLTEKEKEQLAKGEYVVRNAIDPAQISRVVKVQLPLTLNGPDRSGFFDVLTKGLEPRKMLVVVDAAPIGFGAFRHQRASIVVDMDTKEFGNYGKSDIMVGKHYGQEGYQGWWDKLPAGDSLSNGDIGLLINAKGEGTCVFEAEQVSSMGGRTEVKVYGRDGLSPGATLRKENYRPRSEHGPSDDIDSLVFCDKDGDKLTRVGESFFVPKGFKFFKIGKAEHNYPKTVSRGKGNPKNMMLGTIEDVRDSLKVAAENGEGAFVAMRTDGTRFIPVVNNEQVGYMPKESAFRYLIYQHGVSADDAHMLLKSAAVRSNGETFFIKYGWGEPPQSAWFPEPLTGMEYGINVPIQYPSMTAQNLGQNDSSGARDAYRHRWDDDLNQPYRTRFVDQNVKDQAGAASQLGQKEVLDTSVITGLVKTMDSDSAVDGYIGDLLLALDRLGRILFLYYWHNDKFRERYGSQDMSELEDNLRNVFKNLGELALFLKQKTVEPDKADTSEAKLTDVVSGA